MNSSTKAILFKGFVRELKVLTKPDCLVQMIISTVIASEREHFEPEFFFNQEVSNFIILNQYCFKRDSNIGVAWAIAPVLERDHSN